MSEVGWRRTESQAIENFNFAKPEEWLWWIRHFERFRQASDLASKSQEVQISTFVYSMGDKAKDLLESFNLAKDEAKQYETVKAKFEGYIDKRRNTIYDRARFNMRIQHDNERVDELVADLHRLAKHCNYGSLHDELICDRIDGDETEPRDYDKTKRSGQDATASSERRSH